MKNQEIRQRSTRTDFFGGLLGHTRFLWLAAAFLLLLMLGGRELWTQEHRWADIVSGMFFRHDFFHPYLGSNDYYDKPLLSYWLIALVSLIPQELNTWVLRLPSALAGLLAIASIYRLGTRLRDQNFGLLCAWLLLTTFYFVFWARVSSADMLNLAGSLFAVCWYFEKRDETRWMNYAIFYLILALTSLCKGLVGAVVPVLAILPDLLHQKRWKQHLHPAVFLAALPAVFVYILPFIGSSLSEHGTSYGQNGLYLVYRENILRYFKPFDHKDPIYTYFIYLPIYLLPWTLFFIPALLRLKARWPKLTWNSKWIAWALLTLFVFFTASGSRRSYYVLPMVPFAILMTADWLYSELQSDPAKQWVSRLVTFFLVTFFAFFTVLQPLFYSQGGNRYFAEQVEAELETMTATNPWQFVLLDPESKVSFYLHLPPQAAYLSVVGQREQQTLASLEKAWPQLTAQPKNVIFISRKRYQPFLQQLLPHYKLVKSQQTLGERLLHLDDAEAPVAFIPPFFS